MKGMPWRDQTVTAVIAAIVTLFGVVLIQASGTLALLSEEEGAAAVALRSVAWVFIGIACYTAAVVTGNVFTTLVAGRVRLIAQYRLLGASAGLLRRRLALEGFGAALVGGVTGFAAGIALSRFAVLRFVETGALPPMDYPLVQPDAVVPGLVTAFTVVAAAWLGSRAVGRVAPVQALSATVEAPAERSRASVARIVLFWLTLLPGLGLLAFGVVFGLADPGGVVIAFFGGVGSFTAVVIAAPILLPRLMRLTGRLFGQAPPARLARENAVRQPRSAARGALGMVIGVTLVVMFIVAAESFRARMTEYLGRLADAGEVPLEIVEVIDSVLATLGGIMVGLTVVSGVLAAIGMIANLGLRVLQRRRELGLLRAVGTTAGQLRASITAEAAIASIVGIGFGTLLGVFYGWVGAQSAIGALDGRLFWPSVPWQLLAAVAAACVLLSLAASVGPALRSTRLSPLEALRVA
ncbi:MAG: ABC transporter permease [Pseudoclavibacter sp.]|nr:ABC transporter permease [Pseudoclavibacter sp.]